MSQKKLCLPFSAELLKSNFKLERLQEKHITSTVMMFTKAFCDAEPMTRYVNMPYAAFKPFAQLVTEKAAKDGLSAVACDGDRVISCALIEDITNPLLLEIELDEKFKYIFTLLEKLTSHFFVNKIFPPNHLAHLFITAVDNDYRNLGLSRQINCKAMEIACEKHFDFMYSELTNYLNEKGTIKYLFFDKLLIGNIVYQDFVVEDKKPFAQLLGGADAFLWELHPHAKLSYTTHEKLHTHSLQKILT